MGSLSRLATVLLIFAVIFTVLAVVMWSPVALALAAVDWALLVGVIIWDERDKNDISRSRF